MLPRADRVVQDGFEQSRVVQGPVVKDGVIFGERIIMGQIGLDRANRAVEADEKAKLLLVVGDLSVVGMKEEMMPRVGPIEIEIAISDIHVASYGGR